MPTPPAPPSSGAKRPTAYDVARLAGVSQSAVSRAFTPGASISPKARARVVEAAKALGYRPNSIARSLITQRSRLIGVAMAYMENQFYPAALEALSQALARAGYRVLLFTPAPDGDSDPILDEVLRYQVEAVVLASTSLTSHFAEECAQARVPVVMFNRRTERALASSITGDNVAGGREIAAFLAAGGHNRFAYVAGLPESSTSRDRELGYRGELERLGLALHDRVVGRYDLIAAREAARALFSAPEPPDAVFCANDHMAFAVMDVARLEFGLKIGRDVSIVGFDDTPLAAWPAFDLTTYAQSAQTMAQLTADAVLRLLEDPDREPIQQIVPGRLVVRGSARRPAEREWQD